jgi:hypothetical protein
MAVRPVMLPDEGTRPTLPTEPDHDQHRVGQRGHGIEVRPEP